MIRFVGSTPHVVDTYFPSGGGNGELVRGVP